MQQHMPANVYRGRRRKRARRQKWIGLAVLAVAVVVLFVVALLVSLGSSGASPSVADSGPSAPSAPPPVVSSSLPESSSLPPEPPREPTEWDEEGIPALFNRFNYIPDDWETDLIAVGNGNTMDRCAGEAFMAMVEAAAADGVTLTAESGFRTPGEQYNNYHNKLNYWLGQGLSQEEATERTERYHAIPGTSEHEAGLAMDIGNGIYDYRINDSFADTEAFAWLQKNITKYGFIYRYKAEEEAITHIAWEPWHYRYVGANHAEQIVELGITLEEYVDMLCRAEGKTPPVTDQNFTSQGGASGAGSSGTGSSGSDSSGSSGDTMQVPPSMR